jgi:starch-binding outer membrane protein, SusD/RagB family
VSNGIGRLNKNAALALKARAHLYRGEWAQAEAAATEVIASGRQTLMTTANYANIWLTQNSSETIWELQYDINNTNSIAFWYYPTALGGRNEFTSTASLRDGHEADDVRKAVNATTSPANKTQKYTRINGTDNVQLIRLAEMFLIRAEALAQQNKIADAVADLNVIRNRAGLPSANPATAADVVDAVIKERRFEFAHEGHRWFDLRRIGQWNALGLTESFRSRWPIPLREVQTSSEIIAQNPGY